MCVTQLYSRSNKGTTKMDILYVKLTNRANLRFKVKRKCIKMTLRGHTWWQMLIGASIELKRGLHFKCGDEHAESTFVGNIFHGISAVHSAQFGT